MVFLSDYVESSCEVFWGTNRVPLWRYNIHSYKMQASILGIDMLNNGVEIGHRAVKEIPCCMQWQLLIVFQS